MKTLKLTLVTALFFLTGMSAYSQARMQLIHNSADAAAIIVDVWLDETLLIDNFEFRTASAFMDAPAGVEFTIAIQGPDSQGPEDPIWSQAYTLEDGETYILVAEGIISATGYDPPVPFDVAVYPLGRETATASDRTDALVHHGSTDAPIIDIYETGVGVGLLVDNLAYSEFSGYLELQTADYILEVRDETGANTISAYSASFQSLGLKGSAITVIASGFLDPAGNSNGPGFGLWVAIAAGGDLIELPLFDPKARVQFIHNSADAAAAVVDVWLDETLLIDNFAFRTASPFIDAPVGETITIAIQGPDSQGPEDPIWSHDYTLIDGETYIFVAEGIISPSGYDPATPFDIAVFPTGREVANMANKTDMLFHHGSTDAPVLDIYETGVGAGLLVDDLAYSEYDGYLELDPLNYIFEVRDGTGTVTIGAYNAPLATLGWEGEAISVIASGFLDPAGNSNGPAFGLWVALASGGNLVELHAYTPTARVQFIHNSADIATEVVDVWLDETLLIDNFAFRTASPFMDIPAGVEFTISILGPDSQGPDDPIWSHNYTLTDDGTYVMVADGIISASGYDPAVPFDIAVFPTAREEAFIPSQTDMLVHHGSTDAPAIDIVEVGLGLGTIIENLAYSQFAGYLGMATVNYILEVRDENGITRLGGFEAPLQTLGLEGEAITIVASGFLDPSTNSNGPDFGLWVALAAGGSLIKLPEYNPMARMQVIHNSADTAVELVDVWLNQTLLLDNFAFRTASPFIDAPAEELLTVAIKGPDSQDPFNPLWSQNYTLTEGGTYIFVAEGIVSDTGFNPVIPFDMAFYSLGRESATNGDETDILLHHGATDAPTIDIYETGVGAGLLADDLAYAEFAGYLELATMNYIFEVRDESGTSTMASYRVALETLGLEGAAITVVASGFLNPANNSNGSPFGLWAARASGGDLVELPVFSPSARVQIIHNSADAATAEVDVWLNETLLLDNFAFRTASPFNYLPAGSEITIAILGPDSQSPDNPLWSENFNFTEDETYILVAGGILSSTGYTPAPPFDIFVYTGAREWANASGNTDVLVFHGSTDAPVVDIVEVGTGAGSLVDNLSYGEYDGYVELPTANYSLDVREESGTTALYNFSAPLASLSLTGESLTILASGFMDPDANAGGAGFGLLAVMADGTAMMLVNTTGIDDSPVDFSTFLVYPNPANDHLNVQFELKKEDHVRLELLDLAGRIIRSIDLGTGSAGIYQETINIEQLPAGMYMLDIRTGEAVVSRRVIVN